MTPHDPHARRLPAAPGRRSLLRPKTVTVIGAGIAGLSAATILAERGVDVTIVESSPRLGGRVSSWPVADGRTMSRGFHAFFRQYYNLRDLLSRTDPDLDRLRPIPDYPLTRRGGPTDSFASIPRTPPFNLLGFVLSSPTFPLLGLTRVDLRTALELIDVDFPDSFSHYDGESAAAFLDRLRFPTEARHLALEVFARSFFAHPSDFSAGELVAMFHTYFAGSAEGLLFDVPDDDYDTALWSPLGRYLEDLGVRIETITAAHTINRTPGGWSVETTAGTFGSDSLVIAADPESTRQLIASVEKHTVTGSSEAHRPDRGASTGRQELHDWFARIAAQRNAPPFAVLRLWFAEAVSPDRPAFLGTSGFELLDNISVLERFEAGATRWAEAHSGSVVELHAYALADHLAENDVEERLLADLHEVYPETRNIEILHRELLTESDCGLTDTRAWAGRPGVSTPLPGLVLAGDHVRCELPVALMERAATTGYLAANELLGTWRVAGTPIWSPPPQGLLRRGLLGRLRQAKKGTN
ncbi:FAD-dependent oxidoreductase [Brevibacterium permense]|uniref:FAD-dependent oxidoreductase n=1 Tax=Brevibacterium permense TaxID=234834 RepID=UPI0021CF6EFD|nr:FAD-dependent oxidoreductase [Brevibacterium permense]MCU4299092.1 FAD-dependent oxidoreductase [Brevibacterium permense]